MSKFRHGDELFWHTDNTQVTVVDIYDHKPKLEPVYLIRHKEAGTEFNEREMFLYKNKEVFPNARYRVGEEVYFHSKQHRVKPVWYEIINVFLDKGISDEIMYTCRNEKGEIRNFSHYDIFLYDFAIIIRQ